MAESRNYTEAPRIVVQYLNSRRSGGTTMARTQTACLQNWRSWSKSANQGYFILEVVKLLYLGFDERFFLSTAQVCLGFRFFEIVVTHNLALCTRKGP